MKGKYAIKKFGERKLIQSLCNGFHKNFINILTDENGPWICWVAQHTKNIESNENLLSNLGKWKSGGIN